MPGHSKAVLILALALIAPLLSAEPVSFSRQVAPIFQKHCVGCHKEGKAKGKYRLDTYSHAIEELVAGNLEESELWYRLTTGDEDDLMPAEADPLARTDLELIRRWIEEGARYDGDDPRARLASIVPIEPHPEAPEVYPRPLPISALVFAMNGRELITSGYYELLVWDAEDGSLLRRIRNNGQRTYDLALSPDGTMLAAATGSPGVAGEVRVFDPASGAVLATPLRSEDCALSVAFDPAGARLAAGGTDGTLHLFDTGTWKETISLTAHSDWINDLAWNEDGSRLATASRDKTAKVFDLSGPGKRLVTFSGHSEPVRGVAFHQNGAEVISCADDGLVLLWKIGDGKKAADLANLGGPVLRLAGSEAGYFATGPPGLAVQFNRSDHKKLRDLRVDPPVPLGACALGASSAAVGTIDGRVVTFDLESGERRATLVAVPR